MPKLFSWLKSVFLNGFLTLLPITLTILIIRSSFRVIKFWLEPIYNLEPAFLQNIPHSEFFFVLLFIFLVGLVLKFFILKQIIKLLEKYIIGRLPLIRTFYTGIKQLARSLTSADQESMHQVVMIKFPSDGIHSLGFLTGRFPKELAPDTTNNYWNVYVPTTPNPTTGYYIILTEDKFRKIDLTRKEAMTIIISGGIIKPRQQGA